MGAISYASSIMANYGLASAVMDPKVPKAIGKYLRDHGISNKFVCDKTNSITPNMFCMILSGERQLKLEEYAKICEALELKYEFFIGA